MQQQQLNRQQDWLGLTKLASFLVDQRVLGEGHDGRDDEIVDRLYRVLEIFALVEGNADSLRALARHEPDHDAMHLAGDLRRLANRLETFGEFMLDASRSVIELEAQLLTELDARIREPWTSDAHRHDVSKNLEHRVLHLKLFKPPVQLA